MIRFNLSHGFGVWACYIRSNLTSINALLDKVRPERVLICTVPDNLLHPNRLPVSELAHDVRHSVMVTRLAMPDVSELLDFFPVVSVTSEVLVSSELPNPWGPNEHCHDVVVADPTLVFLARTDLPLGGPWHELLVAKLSLDDQFLRFESRLNRSSVVDTHGLYDIPQLQPLPYILPLLVSLIITLEFE